MIQNISRCDGRAMQWSSCENQKSVPKSTVLHCASHRLNLCVGASCRIPMIEDMMSQISAVSDFFRQSPIRCAILKEMIESLCPGADVNNVCLTGWIARLDAFDNLCDLFFAILTTIQSIGKNVDGKYSRSNLPTIIYGHLSVSNYCNSCNCQKNLIMYKRSYQETAKHRQRFTQSHE